MSAPGFWDWLLLVVCVGSAAFNTVFAVSATRRLKRLRRVLAWRQRRADRWAFLEVTRDQKSDDVDHPTSTDRGGAS